MKRLRVLSLVVLIYVGLDLSLPAMPGAFVFDPGGSLESVEFAGSGSIVRDVVLATPVQNSLLRSPQPRSEFRHRLPANRDGVRAECPGVKRLPRASCSPTPEDPH